MSGLYIKELRVRGDLSRCLVVAPGSLVEQWQEELWDKFNLHFEILSRQMVETSLTANPFLERDLLIARMDQVARSEDLKAKLAQAEWDLVIVDEAHKMAAHRYGTKIDKTKRFQLGEQLRDQTRNLLLLTATPHNGKHEEFLLFMSLLDPDRFGGRAGMSSGMPDTSDVMRRYVKEKLLTFEGKRLFPERRAESLYYDLSYPEERLYEAVTDYVREGMNRADALREGGDKRGFVMGFALAALQRRLASSPEAIYQSLRRRRERVEKQLAILRRMAAGESQPADELKLPRWMQSIRSEAFDFDEYGEEDLEALEDTGLDAATAQATADELEHELAWLHSLERHAGEVRSSRVDRKWNELANFLQSDKFQGGDPPQKLLVFTEHKDTLRYLTDRIRTLLGRTEAVVNIHGGMKREDRRLVQDRFRNDPTALILVATDAAGEGVNLQRANLMVNYDLPWNPNRIEQRFGRIHRIGQSRTCFLWNLVAHNTREGKVFDRLLTKIEQQRQVYGDQVYDVLGDPQINRSLQKALLDAIRYSDRPAATARTHQIIEGDAGTRLKDLLEEQALAPEIMSDRDLGEIRDRMERAQARKLQPGFIAAFFSAALDHTRGRMARREQGRFEVTRVPAKVRSEQRQARAHGPVHSRYERVTFHKELVEGVDGKPRAELIAAGHPLLSALIDTVLDDCGTTLDAGAILVDESDPSDVPRVLVYLDHAITDGRKGAGGRRHTVSRRFQFVEVDRDGNVTDPGADPYLNYRALTEEEVGPVADGVDHSWAEGQVEQVAQAWAISSLATPHFEEVATLNQIRVGRVRRAVERRLDTEIRYWDRRGAELKQQEMEGARKRRQVSSAHARRRADELAERKQVRLKELEAEANLASQPPKVLLPLWSSPVGY